MLCAYYNLFSIIYHSILIQVLYDKGGRGRRLLQHPPVIVYFFCKYISSYLLFFISLCSILMPLELGTGSNMSRDIPDFLGLELSDSRCQSSYFSFSVFSS